jgi:succinyl-diaminopimelate desuccinylase
VAVNVDEGNDIRGRLIERLERDRDEIVGLVQNLVRIPTENPPGITTEIFDFLGRYLDDRGIAYEIVAPEPTMPNIVAAFDGAAPGKHLVLNGHLDDFPAGDPARWSDDPHSGAIRDGKLYGRGVGDMKTGTAASILTYIYLHEIRQHLKGRLTLTVVSDEETFGPYGSKWLVENRSDVLGDALLNGEPSTASTIRTGEKGMLWLEFRVRTTGGYGPYAGSTPNAIDELNEILTELRTLSDLEPDMPGEIEEQIAVSAEIYTRDAGEATGRNLRRVSVNTGLIEGGNKVNLIAAESRAEVDIRLPIGIATQTVLHLIDEILSGHEGASYRIINRAEPNFCDPDHPLVRILQDNAEAALGIRPVPALTIGGTDTRLWRVRGIPAYYYGPTSYNIAAPDEHVTLTDLLGTVRVHVLSAFDYLTS